MFLPRKPRRRSATISILDLPYEPLFHITSFLSTRDQFSLLQTSVRLYNILSSWSIFWQKCLPPHIPDILTVNQSIGCGIIAALDEHVHWHRLQRVIRAGEYSSTYNTWLVALGFRKWLKWGYVTLGNELQDIVWGNSEDGLDERYWRRCKESFSAVLRQCWRLDMSTSFLLGRPGTYRAFVVIRVDCRTGLASVGGAEVYFETMDDDGKKGDLGRLTGVGSRVVEGRGREVAVLFLSKELGLHGNVRVGIRDRDTRNKKCLMHVCAIGFVAVDSDEKGEHEGDIHEIDVRKICWGLYKKSVDMERKKNQEKELVEKEKKRVLWVVRTGRKNTLREENVGMKVTNAMKLRVLRRKGVLCAR